MITIKNPVTGIHGQYTELVLFISASAELTTLLPFSSSSNFTANFKDCGSGLTYRIERNKPIKFYIKILFW